MSFTLDVLSIQCCQTRDLGARLGYFSLFLPPLASISGPIEINGKTKIGLLFVNSTATFACHLSHRNQWLREKLGYFLSIPTATSAEKFWQPCFHLENVECWYIMYCWTRKVEPCIHSCIFTRGGGGYLVERWVWGCATQIGCFFGISGLPMAPFLFENWFRYRSRFCKMHDF